MLKLFLIKTNKGIYISEVSKTNYLIKYLFDGKYPEMTYNDRWVFLKDHFEINKVQIFKPQRNINYRLELKNPELESDAIPFTLEPEDVMIKDGYSWEWKKEFEHFESLYTMVSDKQPDKLEDMKFEIVHIFEIDDITNHEPFSYPAVTTDYKIREYNITEEKIIHQLKDTLIFPELILSDKPCKLSSKDSFDIIRTHVKRHINTKFAEISSDYDFHFSVNKVISLDKPEEYIIDISKKRKPKYEKRFRNTRKVSVLNIKPKNSDFRYGEPAPNFIGKNQTDLKNNIDNYLNDLMETINEPLVDCPHCNGMGVIIEDKKIK